VAPKGQGDKLREAYLAGGGLPSLIGVEGTAAEDTLQLALAYASGIGALKGGGTLSSFREEAITDQFGEQVVLCGGLVELIVAAWETLVERGYSPEVAYFECLHEVKLIVDLIHAHGIDGMRQRISSTAAFGGLRAGSRLIDTASRATMKELLSDIEEGRFARAFVAEQSGGATWLREAIEHEREHPIVRTHPYTGQKAIYLEPNFLTRIAGLPALESDFVCRFLATLAHDVSLQCRFRWGAGDVAIWDERVTQHIGAADHAGSDRVMVRCTVEGERPR